MEPNEPLEIEIQHDKTVRFETVIAILVLVILVLGGIIWYLLARHVLPPLGGSPTATSTPSSGQTTQSAGDLSEQGKYYDVSASYPVKTTLSGEANTKAVEAMKQWEMGEIAAFKKPINDLSPAEIQQQGLDQRAADNTGYSLDLSYETASGTGTVSYIFTEWGYTLGAHGNSTFKTFVFNAKTGAQMNLSDLFAPGNGYLTELSTKARALLPAIIAESEGVSVKDVDMEMLRNGTTPDANNFSAWYIDGKNLVILFAPYQVAPYSADSQKLSIPLSSLKTLKANTSVNDFGTVY